LTKRLCNENANFLFAVVSKAFQILSDPDKKSRFDKFGGDPDSRHSAAAPGASPFGRASTRGGGDWSSFDEQEITPEELFRQFFGGGGGGFPGFGI
jgi:DnaJ homolog subfamily B member 12